jgi:hypothetical protein
MDSLLSISTCYPERYWSAYDPHRNEAVASPEQFGPPREPLDMVSESEHLLVTREGVFGSEKPTCSPTTKIFI